MQTENENGLDDERGVVERQQPHGPSTVKFPEINLSGLFLLAQKQGANQEAADDKEKGDAIAAIVLQGGEEIRVPARRMVQNDEQNRNGAESVQTPEIIRGLKSHEAM